jgi:hypothetical protein
MDLPNRASDAGPEEMVEETQASPEELVSLATEYINLYWMAKRNALYGAPKSSWRVHLTKAIDLLNDADVLEIDA